MCYIYPQNLAATVRALEYYALGRAIVALNYHDGARIALYRPIGVALRFDSSGALIALIIVVEALAEAALHSAVDLNSASPRT